MKHSRLLLLIPALLLSSCGDAEHIGNKVNTSKAASIYEDINLNYEKEDCYVTDFTREAVTGKGDTKLTEKLRYKAKSDGQNIYLNLRKSSAQGSIRSSSHTEYYLFQDKTYGTILFVRDENLVTKAVNEIAVPYSDVGSYYSKPYVNNFKNDSYLQFALSTSYIRNTINSYITYDPSEYDDDSATNQTKAQFYSTGKGNITLKLLYSTKKGASIDTDYEDITKAEATLTIDNYRSSKITYETTSTFGNKETWNLQYTYPKSVKIEPPENWQTHLQTYSYQYGTKSTY